MIWLGWGLLAFVLLAFLYCVCCGGYPELRWWRRRD